MRFFSETKLVKHMQTELDVSFHNYRQSYGSIYFGRTKKGRYVSLKVHDSFFKMEIEYAPERKYTTKKLWCFKQFKKVIKEFKETEETFFN